MGMIRTERATTDIARDTIAMIGVFAGVKSALVMPGWRMSWQSSPFHQHAGISSQNQHAVIYLGADALLCRLFVGVSLSADGERVNRLREGKIRQFGASAIVQPYDFQERLKQ
jgi:hypothetical protein